MITPKEAALIALSSLTRNVMSLPEGRERAHLKFDVDAAAEAVRGIQELKRPRKAEKKPAKAPKSATSGTGPLDDPNVMR